MSCPSLTIKRGYICLLCLLQMSLRQVDFHARALWDYTRLNPHEPCDGS
nr:MAG TPA: hypothetical protein [Bacteriophage sp.]